MHRVLLMLQINMEEGSDRYAYTTPLIKVETEQRVTVQRLSCMVMYMMKHVHMHVNLQRKQGYTFIHPFDDPAVATGQGTIAMEIVQELPLVDYILVPIGGGGLATGVSTLAKLLNPNSKSLVLNRQGACMKASLKKGEVALFRT